jgi:hypothetical protein
MISMNTMIAMIMLLLMTMSVQAFQTLPPASYSLFIAAPATQSTISFYWSNDGTVTNNNNADSYNVYGSTNGGSSYSVYMTGVSNKSAIVPGLSSGQLAT